MQIKLKQLIHNKFVRNVAVVAMGTAGAQAVTIAFTPVITRIYGPEEFGLLGVFMATLAMIVPISALAYPVAIVPSKSDPDARGIAKLSIVVAFIMSILTAVVLLSSEQFFSELLGLQAISGYLFLIPLAMFFSAAQQIMEFWLIRHKGFSVTARVAVSQSIILNLSKVGVGLFNPVGAVLIVLATLGKALYAVQLWIGARNIAGGLGVKSNNENKSIKYLANQYRDYPLYRAPQVLLSAISHSIPVLLLASFFGPVYAGLYSLSKSILTAPAVLIGNSVANVFYQKSADMVNNNINPTRLLLLASAGILLVVSLPFSIVMITGPTLFGMAFGEEWRGAGEFAQWMAIWLAVSVAARPTVAIIPVLNIQRFYLLYELFFNFIKISALLYGALVLSSANAAVAMYSLASSVFYIILFFVVLCLARKRYSNCSVMK